MLLALQLTRSRLTVMSRERHGAAAVAPRVPLRPADPHIDAAAVATAGDEVQVGGAGLSTLSVGPLASTLRLCQPGSKLSSGHLLALRLRDRERGAQARHGFVGATGVEKRPPELSVQHHPR